MATARAYVDKDDLRRLSRRSDAMGAWLVAHAWGVILLAVVLFGVWPNPFTFVLAVMLIGSRQLGLAILMHEAAHGALFASHRLNERVGQWLCAAPILADMRAYRRYHLTHHRHTQTERDPDLPLSAPFPTTRASLIRKFLRDLTGQTGVKLLFFRIVRAFQLAGDMDAISEAETSARKQNLAETNDWRAFAGGLAVAACATILLGALGYWWHGHWWWGFAFWWLPLLTWFQLVVRVRNIAEHGGTEQSEDAMRNVRTTLAGPLMRTFVAPYWVNYHLEHHVAMYVPCWRLPELHTLLLRDHGERMRVAHSYADVMRKVGWWPAGAERDAVRA